MQQAVDACGHNEKVAFALDCASSETYDAETDSYELAGKRVTSTELIDFSKGLTEQFNLVFIEDLLDENDWTGFSRAVQELTRTIVLGDDLIVTNPAFLDRTNKERAVDGFILKPKQVGTITEALQTYHKAIRHGLLPIPPGRSGP